ncbi:MAG: class I SAM-dependent methyltransferase [Elusimicrobia bacterium]|nr:class I SAM-dependent methyltransferase [Elusimicrobiota bacterium]MBU2614758.1 class I SAM-dependent methyltransferase [Elusimicrobiota bacterium]
MKYHRENYNISEICPLWADYQVVKLIEPGSSILEIGCATGYIGKYLKEKLNCKMFAVEIDKEAAKIASPYYEKIIIGDIEDENIFQQVYGQFDYVLCMNVLEHLKNPEALLFKLKKIIKNNGFLVAAIPNIANWTIRLKLLTGNFDYEKGLFGTDHGKGIMDETHLRFFTLKTMKSLFSKTGYEIVRQSFDPDKGIPKFHGLLLRLPQGWKILNFFYSLNPKLFGLQFIFKLKAL